MFLNSSAGSSFSLRRVVVRLLIDVLEEITKLIPGMRYQAPLETR